MSSPPSSAYALLGAFVDELARCGMRDACTSPGSRSTPLVLSLLREPRLRCHSHVDERCSGFFALGLAKASALPVAVACTSGTAVAELLPAVVEAHEARVPLIVLSADRPPELREVGAGQTIDQIKLYGGFAKWFFEVGTHEPRTSRERVERENWMRTLACRAWWTAIEGRPGVVHLNFPLRDPLIEDELARPESTGRLGGIPYLTRPARTEDAPETLARLKEMVEGAERGVLVLGRHERDTPLADAAAAFCQRAGWPLLADPMSGARRGEAAVAHYDGLLRVPGFAARYEPDLIVRAGDLPVSKPLRAWLAGLAIPQVSLDPERTFQDPASVVCESLALEPAATFGSLALELEPNTDPDWLGGWRSADERAAEAILGVLGGGELTEPAIAAELGVLLPQGATLFVASSMPVREIETFWPVRADPPRVLCNRGANGIDGTVSSALGAAAAGDGPVVLLIGDVALAYDLSALLAVSRLELKLTIVLVNNGGGGIFDFLPVSGSAAALQDGRYERHVATPTGVDFAKAADLYGLDHRFVRDIAGLRTALERALQAGSPSCIVEARTDRAANVELHRRVWRAVSDAV